MLQVLDKSSASGSPYKAVVGSDSWAIALTVEELQSFVQARVLQAGLQPPLWQATTLQV